MIMDGEFIKKTQKIFTMTIQERKSELISNLIWKEQYITTNIKRVGNYYIGDTVISNNNFIGKLRGANIVFNRIFCHIELFYNGEFFMHHFVDSKDLMS